MSSKLSGEALRLELIAQKKRAQALAYLDKNGCGPGKIEGILNSKGESEAISEEKKSRASTTDNTLDLLLHRKIAQCSDEKKRELSTRELILKQQEEFRNKASVKSISSVDSSESNLPIEEYILPANWQAVTDKNSGQTYYWNKTTNETKWERPKADSSTSSSSSSLGVTANSPNDGRGDCDPLPAGWVEVVHAATKQKYYIHQATGEKRWTAPTEHSLAAETPKATAVIDKDAEVKRKSKYTAEQEREKRRRLLIDPLDPTAGIGKWGDGIASGGKMADSTASGPLWQQRPYPAPGMALKGKDKDRGKESGIGPMGPAK